MIINARSVGSSSTVISPSLARNMLSTPFKGEQADFYGLRIGFVPFCKGALHPFDLRNFIYYARRRNLKFETFNPSEEYDIIILGPNADMTFWSRYRMGGAKIIYMVVDSYLAIPPFHVKAMLRGLAKYVMREWKHPMLSYAKAIKDMCKRADGVVCTTLEQKRVIEAYCKNVHIILDFHFEIIRHVKTDYSIGHRVNLVWEGRPENVTGIAQIKEALIYLRSKYRLSLHIITDLEYKRLSNKIGRISTVNQIRRIFADAYRPYTASGNDSIVYLYQWNPELLSRIITGCDIAVIPLDPKDSLMYGKPENKLLIFWRMGMPTVTSTTPAYIRTMDKCGLQLYCQDNKEWVEKLEKLIVDSEARKYAGIEGKQCADTSYSQEHYLKQWDILLQSVLK